MTAPNAAPARVAVTILKDRHGGGLEEIRPASACPACGCPMPDHDGVRAHAGDQPGHDDLGGWVTCPHCHMLCGVWENTRTIWV